MALFNVGEVVFLKSGSVPLNVVKSLPDLVLVEWLDDFKQVMTHAFPAECLTRTNPNSPETDPWNRSSIR